MTVAVKTLCAQIKCTMHSSMYSEFNMNLHCISPNDFFVLQLMYFRRKKTKKSKIKTKERFEPNTILLYIDAKIL